MKIFYAIFFCVILGSCYIFKVVKWLAPNNNNYKKFTTITISKSICKFEFQSDTPHFSKVYKSYIDNFILNTNTDAFLVIKNDSILYQ